MGLIFLLLLLVICLIINAVATNDLLDEVHQLNVRVCVANHHAAGLPVLPCYHA